MTNLGDIYSFVNQILGKDTVGGYFPPNNFTLIFNEIQVELTKDLVRVFEANRDISQDLQPFIKTYGDNEFLPLQLDAAGKTPFPSDCVYPARANYLQFLNNGCSSTSTYKSITFVSQADFDYQMNMPMLNPLSNPNEVTPLCVIQNAQMLVVPNVKRIAFTCIRFAKDVVFDYDDIDGAIVYLPPNTFHLDGSPSLSVEPEWSKDVYPELARRVIEKKSINLRDSFTIQTNQQTNQ